MSIVTEEAKQLEAQRIELRNAALRRLEAYILAEPRRFDMRNWALLKEEKKDEAIQTVFDSYNPPCGTLACLAGNAVVMDGEYKIRIPKRHSEPQAYRVKSRRYSDESIPSLAKEQLHLTYVEAHLLFYVPELGHGERGRGYGWPASFSKAYIKETDLAKKAQIAVDRIEHFIATGK